ncbi:MAG: nitroreductase family protein [Candidatus Roizmanbacteria bacterium]|nr:nitroreductase family protein [Candidatus Roizmanbacteria bacterium]MCR4313230.1 nitroreductase family protein [Candidatus Roizmanbacteria bacterium]
MITTDQIIDIKKPKLKAEIFNLFRKRFSPRVYSEEEIARKDLDSMIEAARWSPSAMNNQPWFFYIAKSGSVGFKILINSLGNRNYWAKKAPVLILACYIKEDKFGEYGQYDLGQAVFSLVIQARSLGYHSRQMADFNKKQVRNNLKIKNSFFPWVIIAVGKIGDYTKADSTLIEKDNLERKRKENIKIEI